VEHIQVYISNWKLVFSSLRVHTKLNAIFSREVDGDIQHVRANFTTHPQVVDGSRITDINGIVDNLNEQIDNWNFRGVVSPPNTFLASRCALQSTAAQMNS